MTIITSDSRSHYRAVDFAAGAVFDTGGQVRRYSIYVSGGDVRILAGPVTLLGTDVPTVGAIQGVMAPNGYARSITTSHPRLAFRCAAGVTADVWITEEVY
jgi:hypothetical protein